MRRPFVGREAILSLFDEMTTSSGPSVVHLSGAAGIGKTAALVELERRCVERGVPHRWLDPSIEDVPRPVVDEAIRALSSEAAAVGKRAVLVIDALHRCSFGERWLATRLRLAGASLAAVVADRRSASSAWHEASAPLLRELRLAPLRASDVVSYLEQCDVSERHRDAVERFAHGNPLLLRLACESVQDGELDEEALLLRVANGVSEIGDTRAKRFAFAILSKADATTGDLLLHALGNEEAAHEAFEWLRGLSVVEETSYGLVPHPLVRRACSLSLQVHHSSLAQAAANAIVSFGESSVSDIPNPPSSTMFPVDEDDTLVKRRMMGRAPATPVPQARQTGGSNGAATDALAFRVSPHEARFRELLQLRLDSLAQQAGLTDREREVFQLLILGRNTNEIGTVLGITPRTAKFHQQRVLEKIGADSRVDILRLLL